MVYEEDYDPMSMGPLTEAWREKLRAGRGSPAAKEFREVAEICQSFFRKRSGFMWESKFKSKWLEVKGGKSIEPPMFAVTLGKAFELVALFGPTLFWRYPHRAVRNYDEIEFTPEVFGDPNNPMVQQITQQVMQQQQMSQRKNDVRNQVMEKYLNYSQREQVPRLAVDGELAITEALVKGRGLLWPESYQFPGSDRRLTGCFYRSVDDLIIDPDCEDASLRSARWIALEHRTPSWELERLFGLKRGSMESKGSYESNESEASRNGDGDHQKRRNERTFDMVRWYEIWSKGGVGTKLFRESDSDVLESIDPGLAELLDEKVGDFAYLCITKNVKSPLNAPAKKLARMDEDEIADLFEWRCAGYGAQFPCYMDNRWPVAILDFYRDPNSPWPLAPLRMGLGWLITLNILVAAFIETAWDSRRPIVAYLESAAKEVEAALKGTGLVAINELLNNSVGDMIQFLERPGVTQDLIAAIQYASEQFEKSSGLSEVMYAMDSGRAKERSATGVRSKEEKASIRPDKMTRDVGTFMGDAADLEKFLAAWEITGSDIEPLLGQAGAMVWDQMIANEDPEVLVREMKATVEANDIRKPNKARENENMQNLVQFVGPILSQYAQISGDSEPLNSFIDTLGDAMEQNTKKWTMKPWVPMPPPPEVQQQMQQQQQAEQAKAQAEIQSKQLDAQTKSQESQMKLAMEQQKLQNEQIKMQLDAQAKKQELMMEMLKAKFELEADQQRHEQEMRQDQEQHMLDITQSRMSGAMQLQQAQEMGDVKAQAAKKAAAAKPKPQTNGSKK